MNKIFKISLAVAATAALSLGIFAPAQAYTTKQNKVWSFVKANAPEGSSVMGKRDTVNHAKDTCEFLKSGFDFDDLNEITALAVIESNMPSYIEDAFIEWVATTDVAAVYYLCPSQKYKLDSV